MAGARRQARTESQGWLKAKDQGWLPLPSNGRSALGSARRARNEEQQGDRNSPCASVLAPVLQTIHPHYPLICRHLRYGRGWFRTTDLSRVKSAEAPATYCRLPVLACKSNTSAKCRSSRFLRASVVRCFQGCFRDARPSASDIARRVERAERSIRLVRPCLQVWRHLRDRAFPWVDQAHDLLLPAIRRD
jgi:hypothetical protein